jgi:hypothetical protein
VDAAGDAVSVWLVDHPFGVNVIEGRQRTAAGALLARQILSDDAQEALDQQVAIDADGDAVATWRRFDGAKKRIQAAIGP